MYHQEVHMKSMEPGWQQQEQPTACATTQQYSSATSVSFDTRSRKEKFGVRFNNVII
jgi:hypothetical protein